jgi:peptidoglycan/LPS O-acetylase OafA/YrhL
MGVIRVLLAVSVIIAHVGPIFGINVVGAVIAVKAFYIISGFYMSLILNEKYIGGNNSYQLFLSNRLLRLFPIYWAVLLLTVLVCVGMGVSSHGQFWSKLQPWIENYNQMGPGAVVYLIFTNLFLLGQDMAMFLGLNIHTGHLFFTADFWKTNPQLYTFLLIPQAWTVGLEITFYLIAPFIVRRKLAVISTLILLSLSIRLVLGKFGLVNDPWNYRFFPSELVFFLLGNLSYRIYKRIENVDMSKGLLAGITGFVWLYTISYGKLEIPFKEVIYFIVFFLAVPVIFKFSRRSRIDYAIGELSYPVYISHMFVVLFLGRMSILVRVLGPGLTVALVAVAMAMILNKIIARPIEKIRQARVHKSPKAVLAA